jgi:hypothetical protein
MAIGCNAQENMLKMSYLLLQKNFPHGSLGGHVPQCPIASDATESTQLKTFLFDRSFPYVIV